ncbi:hypothetical protein KAR91_81875 [Candidatus Pacearchaeota archaeon]|nr:hypothetical protein [Candidatus Pacearchaeota archaeon]
MSDCIITIPKKIKWDEYKKELDACEKYNTVILKYRLSFNPKVIKNEKCYIVHDGFIRGYHYVYDVNYQEGFNCHTTGKYWPEGWYIQRSGKFNKIKPIPMTGFRGLRYLDSSTKSKIVEVKE